MPTPIRLLAPLLPCRAEGLLEPVRRPFSGRILGARSLGDDSEDRGQGVGDLNAVRRTAPGVLNTCSQMSMSRKCADCL
ncbi:hypothetical protein EDB89DRAFT_2010159 [Lactarius sanguifluus]|nr:hypothetical protein EDB89DRAFT_2010159 [Lactarius sanguifluus]